MNQTMPVSVAMATYNGQRFLQLQLSSILASLHPYDELVVVDDGSSDGTWEALSAIVDSRVRVLRNDANRGVVKTFERAFRETRHPIVFLADQDDIWEPGKRDAFVAAFAVDPACQAVISDARIIDGQGKVIADSFMATRGGFSGSVLGTLLRNRYLGCAMAVRRSVLDAALPIPACAPMHDMWLGSIAALLGRVAYLPQPLLRYRRHDSNVSFARHQGVFDMIRWRLDLVRALLQRSGTVRAAR